MYPIDSPKGRSQRLEKPIVKEKQITGEVNGKFQSQRKHPGGSRKKRAQRRKEERIARIPTTIFGQLRIDKGIDDVS